MRFVAALLATILVGGTALFAPRPVYASAEGEIDSAWIHLVNEDDVVHLDADIEDVGHEQLYLSDPSTLFELELDLSELGDNHDLADGFTLTLTNGAFSGDYSTTTTNGNVDDAACTTTWEDAGVGGGVLAGDVLCAGAGTNHGTTIPFAITLPATGPVVLEVDTTGEDFSVYFFVAEVGDTIYVGSSVLADGGAGCGESGPDFTTDASGHGSVQTALMAAFMAVDDDEDTIVICDGTYTYTDDFGIFDGDPFHDSITVEAETDGGVILDGGTIWGDGAFDLVDELFDITEYGFRILDVQNSSLAIQGLELRNGFADVEVMEGSESEGGGAIRLLNGSLTLDDVSLERNAAFFGGAVLVNGGVLTATGVRATQNAAYAGGAIAIVEGYADIDGSSFEANGGIIYGGALLGLGSPNILVQRSNFSENFTAEAGGAIAVVEVNLTISGGSFIDNECNPLSFGLPDGVCVGGAIAEFPIPGDPILEEAISISRALFRTNGAAGSGGAIYVGSDVLTSIYGSNFIGNSATDQGGAIRLDEGTSETSIMGSQFSANHAAQGGAISINDGFGENLGTYLMQISGNSFTTNSATGSGGALHLAFDNSGNVSPRNIHSNRFMRNTAPNGGAIVVESDFGSERTILRRFERALRSNRFTGNRATENRRTNSIGVHFDFD